MPIAVTLRLDDTAAARVTRLWEKLYVEGLDPALVLPDAEPSMVLANPSFLLSNTINPLERLTYAVMTVPNVAM